MNKKPALINHIDEQTREGRLKCDLQRVPGGLSPDKYFVNMDPEPTLDDEPITRAEAARILRDAGLVPTHG